MAGFDVRKQSLQVRQQIGYLPENVPIYPELRVVMEHITTHEAVAYVEAAVAACNGNDVSIFQIHFL